MARYKKKRVRELQHDRFRDTAISVFDRLGNLLEGRGKAILYGIAAVVLLAILVAVWVTWSRRKADEARRALGRGIAIATAPVHRPHLQTPPAATQPNRSGLRMRIAEFQKGWPSMETPYHTEHGISSYEPPVVVEKRNRRADRTEQGQLTTSQLASCAGAG